MKSNDEDKVELAVEIKVNQPHHKAILINDGTRDVWIPRSLFSCEENSDMNQGDHVNLMVTEWFAKKEGLI